MKIGIIADALDTQEAGIRRYTKCLLDAMYKLNTDHTFHIIRASYNKSYPKWNEHAFPIKPLPLNLRLRQLTSIPRKLNTLKPDVVFETAHFGPFRLDSDVKRVTMIHDVTPITHPEYHPYSSVIAHKLLLKSILFNADRVITNSTNTTHDVNRLFPSTIGKTVSIPLAAMETKEPIALENSSTDTPSKFLLYVGTIEPRKNLELLLNAFELMEDLELQLVLVGKVGWKENSILQKIYASSKKSHIQQLGKVDETTLNYLYKKASIFVYPSHYEGFGLPILEAMQHGTPVVCSSNSSLPEVAGNAARYITDNNSATELAEQLTSLLSSPSTLNKMSAAGIKQAKRFSWKRTAELTLENLIEVCA